MSVRSMPEGFVGEPNANDPAILNSANPSGRVESMHKTREVDNE